MNFPTLYKKTSTGAIQQWMIFTKDVGTAGPVWVIYTKYGQVGGKIQETQDLIKEGKNVGKKNETTPEEQAEAEAKAKWEKQKKKGYVESKEAAQKDEVDEVIEGGVLPMLAHKFSEHAHKIKFPCYVQPKLDGIRCIAIVKNGACTLWSRTRKPINSCPHIIAELEAIFESKDIVLDGELYNHAFKSNFEHIVHLVRQDEPDKDCGDVQYHIYDMISDKTFQERIEFLEETLGYIMEDPLESSLRLVQTEPVNIENDVMVYFELFKERGYEGAMLRNEHSKYTNKRSYDLQKVKEFDDAEFEITGIDEGRGKLSGHVGAFRCRTKEGKEFLAKMSGDTDRLREYFTNHKLWEGKLLTVQYQGLTGKEAVPRFPVGLAIRDYE